MATTYTHRKENRRVHYDRRRRTWIIETLNPNHHNIVEHETTGDRRAAMAFLRGKATTAAVPPRYKAFIAGNAHTPAFDTAHGRTAAAAIAAVKRKNSPDWKDCVVWVEEIRGDCSGLDCPCAGGFGGEPCDL